MCSSHTHHLTPSYTTCLVAGSPQVCENQAKCAMTIWHEPDFFMISQPACSWVCMPSECERATNRCRVDGTE